MCYREGYRPRLVVALCRRRRVGLSREKCLPFHTCRDGDRIAKHFRRALADPTPLSSTRTFIFFQFRILKSRYTIGRDRKVSTGRKTARGAGSDPGSSPGGSTDRPSVTAARRSPKPKDGVQFSGAVPESSNPGGLLSQRSSGVFNINTNTWECKFW